MYSKLALLDLDSTLGDIDTEIKKYIKRNKLDWPGQTDFEWFQDHQDIFKNMKAYNESSKFSKNLKEKNYRVIIVTARKNSFPSLKSAFNITTNWLNSNNIYFDDIFFTGRESKCDVVMNNGINQANLFVDDRLHHCMEFKKEKRFKIKENIFYIDRSGVGDYEGCKDIRVIDTLEQIML